MSGATYKRPLFYTPENLPPTINLRRQILFPASDEWLGWFNGAFSLLLNDENWQQSEGGVSIEDTVQVYREAWASVLDNYMIGTVVPVVRSVLPDYMLPCDGSQYDRVDYPDLYDLLDSIYIVDADTFRTPDLVGRTVLGVGNFLGTDFLVDDAGGAMEHSLTIGEMPAHTHGYSSAAANLTTIGVGAPEATAVPLPSLTDSAGGGGAHNNMQPYRALNYALIAR